MEHIVGLKDLRENMERYAQKVAQGKSFVVIRRAKPLFRLAPLEDEEWEEVIDFTKIRKGGIPAKELLSVLKKA